KRAYCLKTQPATGETYPKSDLFNKAPGFLLPWTYSTSGIVLRFSGRACMDMIMPNGGDIKAGKQSEA
ncbi:hypothetical protein PTQ47_30520, partial [Klebsiella michiganensis]|uniref:hypothetical protein n=1 Tax=Klebsiella michiganensis TaxID=1134687 RepID=UPI00287E61A0